MRATAQGPWKAAAAPAGCGADASRFSGATAGAVERTWDHPRRRPRESDCVLQWGHGAGAVERHALEETEDRLRVRFNGATAQGPWKARHPGLLITARCFNGATGAQGPWRRGVTIRGNFLHPVVLQWGHGRGPWKAGCGAPRHPRRQNASMGPRQRGAVEEASKRQARKRHESASMGPRRKGRGRSKAQKLKEFLDLLELQWGHGAEGPWKAAAFPIASDPCGASMGLATAQGPWKGRPELPRAMTPPGSPPGFNGATAQGPWKGPRC